MNPVNTSRIAHGIHNGEKANPLLFPKSSLPFDHALFKSPTSEYRGNPLWAWNNRLKRDQLLRQIDHMADMGLGGFHIHSRTGLGTPYMGPEFMGHARACAERAAEKGMLACLYDEDRWPSGYGGGLVTKDNPEYRALHLLITPRKYGEAGPVKPPQGANASAVRSEQGYLIARYEIFFDSSGSKVIRAKKLEDDDQDALGRNVWYAYIETNPDSEWFNTGAYIDSLNKKAVSRFIETTHEVYADALSDFFGSTVPSIFTDEPQFAHKTGLKEATDRSDVFLPWTTDLAETFSQKYGYDLLDRLPELIWDIQQESDSAPSALTRYHFHDHVCETFVDAFMDNISKWCKEHGIFLIGHMMREPTLMSQTDAIGEAMRCYRSLDVPGVDMLSDAFEFNTVKQCSSVARQNGAKGVMCEIYGVTNWTFDFAGHKASGDWQAALGITFRVHHLTWVSMAGEGKRDYPACIGYQSNWYKQYPYIEDHFSRLNVALTRGKPLARVAVIHPIESFWLCFGPKDTNADEMMYRDQAFEDLTKWLIFGLVDFDFVSESLLPGQCDLESIISNKLPVGNMEYEAVIVPNLRTIRSTTLARLQKFAQHGGRVYIAGSQPSLVDAQPTPEGVVSIPFAEAVQFSSFHILRALEPFRDVRIRTTDEGVVTNKLLYQMRDDGVNKYLFICNTDRIRYYPTKIEIRGAYETTVLDTLTGEERPLACHVVNAWTVIDWHFEAIGSVLLRLSESIAPETGVELKMNHQFVPRNCLRTFGISVSLDQVTLSEPNVLLLDFCSYRIGSGGWSPEGEVLRLENDIRRELQLPLKLEALRQPWSQPEEKIKPKAEVTVRFNFTTTIDIEGTQLAIEDAPNVGISIDGVPLERPTAVSGWWVDEDIYTVDLPHISAGRHELELTYAFGLLTNIERVYLLGDFSVEVRSRNTVVRPLDSNIDFGDWTTMGLPFYAGNVTYHCSFTADTPEEQELWLEVPRFAGPVLEVEVPDHSDPKLKKQIIAIDPHIVSVGRRSPGEQVRVQITCYGNRENAFGTIHKPDGTTRWVASNAWRAEHELWMEEYNIKRMGVLQRPRVKALGREVYNVRINPLKKWII